VTARTFATADKLACIQRELRYRRRAYARWVSQDRMTQSKADFEIACMEAIEADLAKQLQAENPDLFQEMSR
jgi:hypothetical protein